jgi:hypothetical protein
VLEILLVLPCVLDLLLEPFKDADGGRVVVDPPGGLERRLDDVQRGDEIVGEAVVQAALELKEVVDRFKEFRICWRIGCGSARAGRATHISS